MKKIKLIGTNGNARGYTMIEDIRPKQLLACPHCGKPIDISTMVPFAVKGTDEKDEANRV